MTYNCPLPNPCLANMKIWETDWMTDEEGWGERRDQRQRGGKYEEREEGVSVTRDEWNQLRCRLINAELFTDSLSLQWSELAVLIFVLNLLTIWGLGKTQQFFWWDRKAPFGYFSGNPFKSIAKSVPLPGLNLCITIKCSLYSHEHHGPATATILQDWGPEEAPSQSLRSLCTLLFAFL